MSKHNRERRQQRREKGDGSRFSVPGEFIHIMLMM